jgi:hypothetical protein
MRFNNIWPPPNKNWSFDVSSLMVLISEELELQYRLSQRSFAQCIAAAPVVGLQSYARSYDLLFEPGTLMYAKPYGLAIAPLRNVQLENAIKHHKLLQDSEFNVYTIKSDRSALQIYNFKIYLWSFVTWLIYGGILALAIFAPYSTWIGVSNILILTSWSILIRLVEYVHIVPSTAKQTNREDDIDAIYILGRDNSAFVLKGSRADIKAWVSRGLEYRSVIPDSAPWIKGFTRITSLLVLLFIFSTIPNGHTMDQLAFMTLNIMAQANVLVGKRLNSERCMSQLERDNISSCKVRTRTHVYGMLIKEFKDVQGNIWIDTLDLLPKTKKWAEWKTLFLKDVQQDPKNLYNKMPGR